MSEFHSEKLDYIESPKGFYYCNVSDEQNIIGVGSFANIYKGFFKFKTTIENESPPLMVAIKYLNNIHLEMEIKDNKKTNSFLYEEIKIMQLLKDNINIVQLLDCDFDRPSTQQCIIMELANCTLCDILYNEKFSNIYQQSSCPLLILQLSWLLDCFDGLQFIHSQNIIHHDIKPDNIFYFVSSSGYGRMKIADFGLSHLHDTHVTCTSLKTNCLTNHPNTDSFHSKTVKSPRHHHKTKDEESSPTSKVEPTYICKGQPVYQPPELFFYPPKCTCSGIVLYI